MATQLRIPTKPIQRVPAAGLSKAFAPAYAPFKAAVKKKATPQVGGQALMNKLLNQYASSIMTPADQAAQAKTQNTASYTNALTGYKEAYDQEQQQLLQQAQRAQGFALAVNSVSPQMGKLQQDAYNTAAQNIQGLGTGLSGAVQQAQQAEADTAAQKIATMEAVTGGAAPPPTGYNTGDLRNTALLTGVTLPSADLYQQAAAAAVAGAARQHAASGSIEDLVQGYQNQQVDNTKTFTQQKLDLLKSQPAAYQQALSSVQDAQRQNMATIISGLGLMNTQAGTQSGITAQDVTNAINKAKVTGSYQGKPVVDTYKVNGKTYTVPNGMHIDPTTGQIIYNVPPKTPGYTQGTTNLAPGYWWGPGGKKAGGAPQPYDTHKFVVSPDGSKLIPIKQPASAPKAPSPIQIASAIRSSAKDAAAVLKPPYAKLVPQSIADSVLHPHAAPSYQHLKLSRAQARAQLLKTYFTGYENNPAAQAQVDRILATIGY